MLIIAREGNARLQMSAGSDGLTGRLVCLNLRSFHRISDRLKSFFFGRSLVRSVAAIMICMPDVARRAEN